jgi:hypothetical protein
VEQLTLPFSSEPESKHYRIRFLKNDVELFSVPADSLVEAQVKRRDLVEVLQRDPRNRTVWEESPRPAGWWGLRSNPPQAATVYNIIIELSGEKT